MCMEGLKEKGNPIIHSLNIHNMVGDQIEQRITREIHLECANPSIFVSQSCVPNAHIFTTMCDVYEKNDEEEIALDFRRMLSILCMRHRTPEIFKAIITKPEHITWTLYLHAAIYGGCTGYKCITHMLSISPLTHDEKECILEHEALGGNSPYPYALKMFKMFDIKK